MRPTYKNTQTGKTILGVLAACGLITIVVYLLNISHPIILAILLPLAICAIIFCSLTIQIQGEWLEWNFGPGFISRRLSLKEIASAEPVQTSWLTGWGIHYARGGWVYNVSGFDAVQITLKDGKRLRLGTDEPEALTAAIRSELA